MSARNAFADLALEETQQTRASEATLQLLAREDTLAAIAEASAAAASEATQQAILDLLAGLRTASNQAVAVGNARSKFRDGFASAGPYADPDVWTLINEQPDDGTGMGHIVNQGGDAAGASYLRISMSPFVDNSSVWLVSKEKFRMPTRVGWGVSASQRIVGQELLFGLAQAAPDGSTDQTTLLRNPPQTPADIGITTATATVTSNVLALPMPAGHPFRPGDRVIVVNCPDTRLNVGPVIITSAHATEISVPLTLANGSYASTGGGVRSADPLARAHNGFGLLLETATAGNASLVARRNGAKPRIRNSGIGTTVAVGGSTPWSDQFASASVYELALSMDECSYRSWTADTNGGPTGLDKFQQSIPDEEEDYRLVVRARCLDFFSRPVARIVSITRAASTTVTVTTDRPHGLTTGSRVGVFGVRDQATAAFPNTTDAAVTSVPDATTFTAVMGSSGTSSRTDGGVVFVNHGTVNSPGALSYAVQSIARTNDVLVVTLNAAANGFLSGEYIHLWGMNGGGAAAYEGAYRVLRQTGSTVELAAPGPNFAAITTGGAVIRRTEFRLHFARVLDHTRHLVEVIGGRGNGGDINNAVPVSITGSTTLNVTAPPVVGEVTESTTNLGASGGYSGASRDLGTDTSRQHTRIKIGVRHLAGIIPGSLWLEQSMDNSTFYETWRCPIPSDGLIHNFEQTLLMRYYRWRFQNGATAQTGFVLHTRRTLGEGAVAGDLGRTLSFPVTATAGQAIPAATNVLGPTLDLGANHAWDTARLLYRVDVAEVTVVVEQSMDGVTWWWTNGVVSTGTGSGVVTVNLAGRYVRARIATGANASALSFAQLALNA